MMERQLRKGSAMGNFTVIFNMALYNKKDPTDLDIEIFCGAQLVFQCGHLN